MEDEETALLQDDYPTTPHRGRLPRGEGAGEGAVARGSGLTEWRVNDGYELS